jgi:hypothetical protein
MPPAIVSGTGAAKDALESPDDLMMKVQDGPSVRELIKEGKL